MKSIFSKYLLIPIILLVLELTFGLFTKHLMQSEPYLSIQKSIDNFMFDNALTSFKSSKTSYKTNESISLNIELNKKSHLYLLTLKDHQACLLFPSHQENNVFEKGEVTLSSEKLRVSKTQTVEEFYLLASKKALDVSSFKSSSCISRNDGLMVMQKLEDAGAEVLNLEVKVD